MENEQIKRRILELYAIHDKRLGVLKIRELLRDYSINISAGRVYRLMKTMLLPTINNKNLNLIIHLAIFTKELIIFNNNYNS